MFNHCKIFKCFSIRNKDFFILRWSKVEMDQLMRLKSVFVRNYRNHSSLIQSKNQNRSRFTVLSQFLIIAQPQISFFDIVSTPNGSRDSWFSAAALLCQPSSVLLQRQRASRRNQQDWGRIQRMSSRSTVFSRPINKEKISLRHARPH